MGKNPLTINHSQNQIKAEVGWWVEIFIAQPLGLQYVGPFASATEAKAYQNYYLRNLDNKNPILDIHIKQCSPQKVTFDSEELRNIDRRLFPLPVLLTC